MPAATTPFLSVVIPSYNERANLRRGVLEEVAAYLEMQPYLWEIVLTDDGSTDGTIERLEAFQRQHSQSVVIVKNVHAGKGPTVASGMLAARGKWRLFTDFDQSTPIQEVEKLLAYIDTHQVIFGSREIAGARRDKEPFYRHFMGRGFNLAVQILAVPGVSDTQCGFKLFSAEATEKLFPKLQVYGGKKLRTDPFTGAFDVELLFLARKHGYALQEVPILWRHHATDRVNPIKDSVRMFFDIMRIRWNSLIGGYGRYEK